MLRLFFFSVLISYFLAGVLKFLVNLVFKPLLVERSIYQWKNPKFNKCDLKVIHILFFKVDVASLFCETSALNSHSGLHKQRYACDTDSNIRHSIMNRFACEGM